jgi:hypothetical protein
MKPAPSQAPSRTTTVRWAERMATDESLRVFVSAEIARAGLNVAAAEAEARHWRQACAALNGQLDALRSPDDAARRRDRSRKDVARRQARMQITEAEE